MYMVVFMIYIVENSNVGERLDIFVSKMNIDLTRSYIKKIIQEDNILVNNKHVKSGYSLKLNDEILIKDIEKKRLILSLKK